jgi:hypothetical protein
MTTSFNWQEPGVQQLLQVMPAQLSQMASDLLNYDRNLNYALQSLLSSLQSLAGSTQAPLTLGENKVSAQEFSAYLYAQMELAYQNNEVSMSISGLAEYVQNHHGLRSFDTKVIFQWGDTTLCCDISFKHSDDYGVAEDSIMIELDGEQHASFLETSDEPFPEQPIDQSFLHWFHQIFKPGDADFSSPYLPERETVLDALGLAIAHLQKQS